MHSLPLALVVACVRFPVCDQHPWALPGVVYLYLYLTMCALSHVCSGRVLVRHQMRREREDQYRQRFEQEQVAVREGGERE